MKRTLLVLLALALVLVSFACSKKEEPTKLELTVEKTTAEKQTDLETEKVTEEPTEAPTVAPTNPPTPTPTPAPTPSPTPAPTEPQIVRIKNGDTLKSAEVEIKINSVKIKKEVYPPDTSSYYTYFPAVNGEVYVFVDADVKNLTKYRISCEETYYAVLTYGDGYTYTGTHIVLRDSANYTDLVRIYGIDPLKTDFVGYLFSCPDEIETSNKSLEIQFWTGGKCFFYKLR